MKIAKVHEKHRITAVQMLPDLESGGVERGTLELSRHLVKKGHRSIVISAGGRMVPELEKSGGEHVKWPVGAKNPVCLPYIFLLRNFLAREKVDILHLRSRVPAWAGVLAMKTLPERRRPGLVTTFHGFYSSRKFSAVMTKGDKVIAISRTIADHIKKEYRVPDHRVELIHRGFDEESFDPGRVSAQRIKKIKEDWGLQNSRAPVIMLPGRLTRWKGQDVFIKSLALLKKKEKNLEWRAICAGDKNKNSGCASILQKMINENGISNRVRLAGHCSDMPAAFMASDIVVSASSTEPEAFGRIAVEAQAMGRPVIASAHGGSLETVKDRKTGWLVPPMDTESLAAALSEALSNRDLREKYGENGRKRVKQRFRTERMCELTLKVYRRVLEMRRRRVHI